MKAKAARSTLHCKDLIKYTPQYEICRYQIDPPFEIKSDLNSIGIDPGTVHFGIAEIWMKKVYLFEVKITRNVDPVERILMVWDILDGCQMTTDYQPMMTVEGASFSSYYRNTELAEIRASAVLWAIHHGIKPRILAPLMIRKVVFGSGKIKAEETWTDFPPNAASALACAYYPFKISSSQSPLTKE